jgi:macrolide transport system ATP-binding/permease protein
MWIRKERKEARVDAEIRDHFERLVHELIASGMQPEEARRRARLEIGDLEQIKEDCRDVRGRWLEDFGKDLRYSARTLRRSPGFLAVSVLSLALGIGANSAIFTLINSVMLRSLPVHDPERLAQIAGTNQQNFRGQQAGLSVLCPFQISRGQHEIHLW